MFFNLKLYSWHMYNHVVMRAGSPGSLGLPHFPYCSIWLPDFAVLSPPFFKVFMWFIVLVKLKITFLLVQQIKYVMVSSSKALWLLWSQNKNCIHLLFLLVRVLNNCTFNFNVCPCPSFLLPLLMTADDSFAWLSIVNCTFIF